MFVMVCSNTFMYDRRRSVMAILCVMLLSFGGCQKEEQLRISGSIDYAGSADIFISKKPVHYKYAPKIHFPVTLNKDKKFDISIPIDTTQIIELNIGDQAYPIVAKAGRSLKLKITRSEFPAGVKVTGYTGPWDSLYSNYYPKEQKILDEANEKLTKFEEGKPTNIVSLYQRRYKLAKKYFERTPLDNLYYKAVGEYLVKRLEQLKYQRRQKSIPAEKIRQNIIEEAKQLQFFSFKSLHAQRAGIRDFTNAYANTFGVADSLDKAYNQDLMQYDVKRLGYKKLDSARTSVLQYVPEGRAKAYAKLFLVAERIGEMPLKISTPGYKKYLNQYSDYPKYSSFLRSFYKRIKRVSPGQPAVPFTLPNQNEKMVHMKDFRGKYVLLDFWASWCIPCLDEFPYMKKIYREYPRDEFEIVGISIEKDSLRWRQALRKFQNPWPQLYGGNEFQQETFRTYQGGGIPFYILVGPKGNIIRYNDVRPSFNLTNVLDSLLSKT